MFGRASTLIMPDRSWTLARGSASVFDRPEISAIVAASPSVLRVIADIAAAFVTIEPDAIDQALTEALKRISNALLVDWATLWRIDPDGSSAIASHDRFRSPRSSRPETLQLRSMPFVASRLEVGEPYWFTRIEEIPDPVDREACWQHGLRSAVVVPVPLAADACTLSGALAVGYVTKEREWSPAIVESLRVLSGIVGQVLAHKASLDARHHAPDEDCVAPVTGAGGDNQDGSGNSAQVCLHPDARESGSIVGRGAAIRRVLEQVQQVAATGSTVLLLGETGTGKELIATQIHEMSARRARLMVRVNCAAIPTTLVESELFGHEKGAFTGAVGRQIGRFELANRSTIFLDEIGDLPPEVQVKLLRVLEERQIEPLGNSKPVRVDVRIIAATHRNLEQQIAQNAFREDLFYRLNVFPIRVPPLRERREDIPLLVWRFVDEFSKASGKRIDAISREDMAALQRYEWPGNIRELRNVVERAMILATGTQLALSLPPSLRPAEIGSVRMDDVEREHIRAILESTGWRIRGAHGAADRLGLRPTTLETRMGKLGLVRPKRA